LQSAALRRIVIAMWLNTLRASALVVALTLLATSARSQPPDNPRAAAIILFDEARQLMQRGDYAAACPKLAEAQRVGPGIGILYNLSNCYEKIGKTASAWAGFRKVAAQAKSAGQLEREQDARNRLETLKPKLSRVVVVVSHPDEGLVVRRDGEPMLAAQWGSEIPVDPGPIRIEASAPGKKKWRKLLNVEGPGAVRVEIPRLEEDETKPASKSPADDDPADGAPADGDRGNVNSWQFPLGIATLATGVAAVGVAAGLGFAAKSKADDADCDEANTCSDSGLADRQDAVGLGNIATGVMIAGGVLAGAGLTIWLTAPSTPTDDDPTPSPAVAIRVGATTLSVSARF